MVFFAWAGVSIVFMPVHTKPAYDRTSNYWCTYWTVDEICQSVLYDHIN